MTKEFPLSGGIAMKIKILRKCLIMLGLLLFFSVFMPLLPFQSATVQAAETVKDKSELYRLSLNNVTIAKGKTQILRTYNVGENAKIYFKSSDEEIASVSNDGVITAKKVGVTVITVTIKDGADLSSLTCNVTVGPAAVSVKCTQSIIVMAVDSVDFLKVILKPSNTVETAKFTSLNSSVASISPGGRISAKSYGLTEVKAYIDDIGSDGLQKYDSCTVIVTSEENVTKLENYFSEHPELDQIPEEALMVALDQFFNQEFDQTSSSTLINSLDRYLSNLFDLD